MAVFALNRDLYKPIRGREARLTARNKRQWPFESSNILCISFLLKTEKAATRGATATHINKPIDRFLIRGTKQLLMLSTWLPLLTCVRVDGWRSGCFPAEPYPPSTTCKVWIFRIGTLLQ